MPEVVHHVFAFDPGLATGSAWYCFTESKPAWRVGFEVMSPARVEEWVKRKMNHREEGNLAVKEHIVSEKFILRSGNQFTADLTPLKIEGKIEMLGRVYWRPPSDKKQVPDDLLKEKGLWVEADDSGWEDARDINDAQVHALGYIAFDLGHRPTLKEYFS